MNLRIAHTADAHIDAATHAPGPASRMDALRANAASLASVVEGALSHDVDVLVHSGDAFANGRPGPEALMVFTETVRPLLQHGIPLVLVEGNHERLRHRRGQRTITSVLAGMLSQYGEVHLACDGPELVRTSSGLQVACLPWVDAHDVLVGAGALGMDEADQHDLVARIVIEQLADLAGRAEPGAPLVSSAHLAASSARRGSERELTHLFREPVVNASDLAGLPMAYHALGHIHTPQRLADGVWYSGSPQKHTFTDEPDTKCWNLVEVTGDNQLAGVQQVPTTTRSMTTLVAGVPVGPLPDGSMVRVRLSDDTPDVPGDILSAVEASGSRIVVVQRPRPVRTAVANKDGVVAESLDPASALRQWLGSNHPDADVDALVGLAATL